MAIDLNEQMILEITKANILENNKEMVLQVDKEIRLSILFWDTVAHDKKIEIDIMTFIPDGFTSLYSNVIFFEHLDALTIAKKIIMIINMIKDRFEQNKKIMGDLGFEVIGHELFSSGNLLILNLYEGYQQYHSFRPTIFIFSKRTLKSLTSPSDLGVIETLKKLPIEIKLQLNEKTRDLLV